MTLINITNHPYSANGFFYLDGDLYKVMQATKASDYLTAWNYHKNGMEEFLLSHIRKYAEPAFRTKQVGEMVGLSGITVRDYYQQGHIPRPKKTYPLGDGKYTPLLYSPVLWSKQDVWNLHDYLMEKRNVHTSTAPERYDKKPSRHPSRSELRATLEHGTVYYVKGKDGNMVKVWKAENI